MEPSASTDKPRRLVVRLLLFMALGVAAGYMLRGKSQEIRYERVEAKPAACTDAFEAKFDDCRRELQRTAARQTPTPVALPSREETPEPRVTRPEVSPVPAVEGAPQAKPDRRRLIAYLPYREYKKYRFYKPYMSDNQNTIGTAADCAGTPNARECIGTEAHCKIVPQDDRCIGTEAYCATFPAEDVCRGTKLGCAENYRDRSCEGTAIFCQDPKFMNIVDCRGTEAFCQKQRRTTQYCFGTSAFCEGHPYEAVCEADDT